MKEILSYIADDGQLGDHLHDLEPDPDILGPLGHGPPRLADELLGVQPDLHPVVEEGEQGGQGEGRHEDCDETELENWKLHFTLEPLPVQSRLPISRYSWKSPSFSTSL